MALPSKKEVMLALLERTSVFIHLDPRRPQVVVPKWFTKQAHLVLQIGLNMPVPIRDLGIDDESVSCTLSFNRSPFFCWIPWDAVFALEGEDQRRIVWPDDVPAELNRPAGDGRPPPEQPARRSERPHLRAVGGRESESAPEAEPAVPIAPAEPAAAATGSEPATEVQPPTGLQTAKEAHAGEVPPAEQAKSPSEAPPDSKGQSPSKSKRPPHLRLVK